MTIYDIAEKLQVSPATVSLALNDDSRIALKTRRRVNEFAVKAGFRRNEQARNFRLGKTNNVAVVVHNIDNDFWHGIVRAVESGLGDAYNVILCNTEGSLEKERKIFKNLMLRKVDGIIVQPTSHSEEHFIESIKNGIPVVSLEETEHELISFVKGDDYQAAYQLTRECIRRGHRRIAFLTFRWNSIGLKQRAKGFLKAIEESGTADTCKVLTSDDLSFESITEVFRNRINDFTLILSSDDRLACQMMKFLAKMKLTVPDDMSVIGWNNSSFLDYLNPPLASVSIPMGKIGSRAASIILENLNSNPTVRKSFIPEEVVMRESFRPLHAASGECGELNWNSGSFTERKRS